MPTMQSRCWPRMPWDRLVSSGIMRLWHCALWVVDAEMITCARSRSSTALTLWRYCERCWSRIHWRYFQRRFPVSACGQIWTHFPCPDC